MKLLPKVSPLDKNMSKSNLENGIMTQPHKRKIKAAGLFRGSVAKYVLRFPVRPPGDELSSVYASCLSSVFQAWSQRGRAHGNPPTPGTGWCPMADWGCEDVFAVYPSVRARLCVSPGFYVNQNDRRQIEQSGTSPLQLCLFVRIIRRRFKSKQVEKTKLWILCNWSPICELRVFFKIAKSHFNWIFFYFL